MKKITFHFYKVHGLVGSLIRARLSSEFAHIGVEFDESNSIHHSTMQRGVHIKSVHSLEKPLTKITIEVDDSSFDKAKNWADSQLGKRYDFKAILGFIVGSKKQNQNGWFCSEYGRVIFEKATGVNLKYHNLVSPGNLRLILATFNAK